MSPENKRSNIDQNTSEILKNIEKIRNSPDDIKNQLWQNFFNTHSDIPRVNIPFSDVLDLSKGPYNYDVFLLPGENFIRQTKSHNSYTQKDVYDYDELKRSDVIKTLQSVISCYDKAIAPLGKYRKGYKGSLQQLMGPKKEL